MCHFRIVMMNKTFEIWMEGYLITGGGGGASFVGSASGVTFHEAVLNWYKDHPNVNFNPETLTDWGCRLYPTYAEAKRAFG